MLGLNLTGAGKITLSQEPLGRGGEGAVYSVIEHSLPAMPPASELVAKIYHNPNEEDRKNKLKAMVSAPVTDTAVAWPLAMIFDDSKRFLGYLMRKLDTKNNRELLYLANTSDRNKIAPDFDTRYALMTVRNMAAVILAVHGAGHRIGDLNESNFFVSSSGNALLVDTDSMQIKAKTGEIFCCAVGKQEYTAPELTHGSLRDYERTIETDYFAFAVAAFQLMTGGVTPHQGVFEVNSDDDPPSTVERIRNGVLPALDPKRAAVFGFSPKRGVPVEAFPEFFTQHLLAFLSVNPNERATSRFNLETLIKAIDSYSSLLVQCQKESLHWHETGKACGWCSSASSSGVDPWGSTVVKNTPQQLSLPAIGFNDGSSPQQAPVRAAPAIAGQQAVAPPAGQQYNPQTNASGPSSVQQAPSNPAPQRPKKIKGKVTVEYADGTWGVRPPIARMFKSNKKMAIWAIKQETPSFLQAWWSIERNVANPLALFIGLFLSLPIVAANFIIFYRLLGEFSNSSFSWTPDFNSWQALVAIAPAVLSLLAVLWLASSGLLDRAKAKKVGNGSLTGFKHEKLWITPLRFIPIAIVYGIPLFVFGGISLLLTTVRAVIKAEK